MCRTHRRSHGARGPWPPKIFSISGEAVSQRNTVARLKSNSLSSPPKFLSWLRYWSQPCCSESYIQPPKPRCNESNVHGSQSCSNESCIQWTQPRCKESKVQWLSLATTNHIFIGRSPTATNRKYVVTTLLQRMEHIAVATTLMQQFNSTVVETLLQRIVLSSCHRLKRSKLKQTVHCNGYRRSHPRATNRTVHSSNRAIFRHSLKERSVHKTMNWYFASFHEFKIKCLRIKMLSIFGRSANQFPTIAAIFRGSAYSTSIPFDPRFSRPILEELQPQRSRRSNKIKMVSDEIWCWYQILLVRGFSLPEHDKKTKFLGLHVSSNARNSRKLESKACTRRDFGSSLSGTLAKISSSDETPLLRATMESHHSSASLISFPEQEVDTRQSSTYMHFYNSEDDHWIVTSTFHRGVKWMWSQRNMVSNECGLSWMWSQMNRSHMNVVSNECSQMNVVPNLKILKWMVSNELVSIAMEPKSWETNLHRTDQLSFR